MEAQVYQPLWKEGFVQIGLWELDKYFLQPFGNNMHRKYLINRLQEYLLMFAKLELDAEVWIDGSFTTLKPDPKDIDLVFLLTENEVNSLADSRTELFEQLLMDREEVKKKYLCDVYFIDGAKESERKYWENNFSFDERNNTKKGIFKVTLKNKL